MQLRRDAKMEVLKRVPLFAGCSKKELAQIASLADELHLKPDTTVIREGARGHEFVVVVDGDVEVRKRGRKLPTRSDASFFGEIALLTGARRNATVKTTTPVRALVIAEPAFRRLLHDSPQIQRKVLGSLAERLAPEQI